MPTTTNTNRYRPALSLTQCEMIYKALAANASYDALDIRTKLLKIISTANEGLNNGAYTAQSNDASMRAGSMASITGGTEYTPEELAEYEAQFMASLASPTGK